ncbi:methyl-accepting chemotaxis protein [Paeniroseomonas aquatica]|nr:HAMP domain-containing methyl-accepting chemotaxis protein [Paeniroseomonas aquatica]
MPPPAGICKRVSRRRVQRPGIRPACSRNRNRNGASFNPCRPWTGRPRKPTAMLTAFRDLRISFKLLLPLIALALVGGGIGAYISQALMRADSEYSRLLEGEVAAASASDRLNLILVDMARAVWRGMALSEAAELDGAIRDLEQMAAAVSTYGASGRGALRAAGDITALNDIERELIVRQEVALRGLRQMRAGDPTGGRQLIMAEFAGQVPVLRAKTRQFTEKLKKMATERSEALTREAEASVRLAILVLGLGLTLGLGAGIWLMLATVVRPFGRLHRSMQGLAGGDLGIQVVDTDRGDEIGAMAQALQAFGKGLRESEVLRQDQEVLKVRAEADRKAALASMATALEERVGGVVEGIAAAASELNAAATSMVGIADATSGRAVTVSNATAEASANVNTVAAATEQLAASVAEISRQVADSARMANGAVDQANRTNATVANLTEAASRIGEVTRLIGDIAGQTNLLALNATIEAARAGEAGKGFAVVASEVKALANQTAQATGNIASQIQAMQAATREAAADIGAIRGSIDQINDVTAAIAAAVEEQGAATRDIAQNVQRAAAGTNEISGAIEGVTAAAAETGGAANQVQSTSGTLAEQAETLKREVSSFLSRVRAA